MVHIEGVNPKDVGSLGGYSHVCVATTRGMKLLHISGQVAADAQGRVVGEGDLHAQTVQCFENLQRCLDAAGASFNDLLKTVIYVKHLSRPQREVIAEVRKKYLNPQHPPASTMIGVTSLVNEAFLIEIEAVAVLDEARQSFIP